MRHNPNPAVVAAVAVGIGATVFFVMRKRRQAAAAAVPTMSARQRLAAEGTPDLYSHRGDQAAAMEADAAAEAIRLEEQQAEHAACQSRGGRIVSEQGWDGSEWRRHCVTPDAYTYYQSQCTRRYKRTQDERGCNATLLASAV